MTLRPLSDIAVKDDFFKKLKERPPILTTKMPYQVIRLKDWLIDLSCTREVFYLRNIQIHSLIDVIKKSGGKVGTDAFEGYLSDHSLCMDIEDALKVLKLDLDDDKPLYVDGGSMCSYEYHVVGGKVLVRSIHAFGIRGRDYGELLLGVDLTKFVEREYNITEDFDTMKQGMTELDVMVDHDGVALLGCTSRIDFDLLRSWMVFEFLKRIFKVKVNPYFERDGMVHLKTEGYRYIEAEFELPKDLVYFGRSLDKLKLSRLHHSDECF